MTIIDEIAAERRRQIEAEGWTPEHDLRHRVGTLLRAAVCYRMNAEAGIKLADVISLDTYMQAEPPSNWPWTRGWWKPKSPRRDLIRAGALALAEIDLGRLPEQAQAEYDRIVAEIERIDREGEEETCRARGEANRGRLHAAQSVYEAAEKRTRAKDIGNAETP